MCDHPLVAGGDRGDGIIPACRAENPDVMKMQVLNFGF
jgi:hypothetical protein